MDEYGLRRPVGDAKVWEAQLEHLLDVAELPLVTIQVLPLVAGAHHLMDGALTLLWQEDGSGAAYTEGNRCGDLLEEPADVTRARLSYDRLRDLALPPSDSTAFIRGVLKEHRA